MAALGVRIPLSDDEIMPVTVPSHLKNIIGMMNKIDGYQHCIQSNSKGHLNKRVIIVTTNTNPPTLFLSREDDTALLKTSKPPLTRVVPLTSISSAYVTKGKKGENVTLLNMEAGAKEPGLLFMESHDSRNNSNHLGNHYIVRVINYLKNQINGTELPLYDVSGTKIDLFKQNSLKRPTGYITPDVKLAMYRNARTGSPFVRRPKEEPEKEKPPPPPVEVVKPKPKPKPKPKKRTVVSPPPPQGNGADRQALRHYLSYYMNSGLKSTRQQPQRTWEPPTQVLLPEEEIFEEESEPVETIPKKTRHVMRPRGEPPAPVYAVRPTVPKADMGVQTAIVSHEDARIDASAEELPFEEKTSVTPDQRPLRVGKFNASSPNYSLWSFDLPVTCLVRPTIKDPAKVRMAC